MKTKLSLLALSLFSALSYGQDNLVSNPGFEDALSTFTVNTDKGDELVRINVDRQVKIESTAPAQTIFTATTKGIWYKVAPNNNYNRCEVHADGDNKFIAMNVNINSSHAKNYMLQKLTNSLDLTKTYIVSFKARKNNLEGKNPNELKSANISLIDLGNKLNSESDPKITDSDLRRKESFVLNDVWTDYEFEFSLPVWNSKLNEKGLTIDVSNMGIQVMLDATEKIEEGNYAGKFKLHGMDIDNISLKEKGTNNINKVSTDSFQILNKSNGIEIIDAEGKVLVYDISGRNVFVNNNISKENLFINLSEGSYIVKVNNTTQKIIVQ